jgi:hypothetical protein
VHLLHGVAASGKTLDALLGLINEEMNGWRVADPREATDDKVLSPLMVHKAQTLVDIVAEAKKTPGVTVIREGGRAEGAYGEHSEAVKPVLLKIRPDSTVRVNWDGKGVQEVRLATTEFFIAHPGRDGAAGLRVLRAVLPLREQPRPGDQPLDPG